MQKHEAETFFAELRKLGMAKGEILPRERQAIYLEDLVEFPLEQVLEAMTWARKNINHFPSIPELRSRIEGDPEAHADRAWQDFMALVQVGRQHAIFLPDGVMAEAIKALWSDWPHAQAQVGQAEGAYEQGEWKKTFKRAYLEAWKRRDRLPGDVTFDGYDAELFTAGRLSRTPVSPKVTS